MHTCAAHCTCTPRTCGEFGRVLPDYRPEDNLGSAYCVRDYVVAAHLGGPDALRQARAELSARGRRLVLDFVPNHVAMDHPWALRHPEYFIHGNYEDLDRKSTRLNSSHLKLSRMPSSA